jgi:transcriptional regulator with XRE-family HTH domain
MTLSPGQCRAARALIGWSQQRLAATSKVAKATIANFETGKRAPYARTLDDVRATLEEAGVAFIDGAEHGVKLWSAHATCAKCGFAGRLSAALSESSPAPGLLDKCPGAASRLQCPRLRDAIAKARRKIQPL